MCYAGGQLVPFHLFLCISIEGELEPIVAEIEAKHCKINQKEKRLFVMKNL